MTHDEIMTEWVEALRSGKYEQGDTYLAQDHKYCCLGVLCEIAAWEGVIPSSINNKTGVVTYGEPGDNEATVLPRAVMKWAGLASQGGALVPPFNYSEGARTLVGLNDSGSTFAEIADVIEQGKVKRG